MRFSLRNLLLATFWFALWAMDCLLFSRFLKSDSSGRTPTMFFVLLLSFCGLPLIGLASLHIDSSRGIAFGFVAACLYLIFVGFFFGLFQYYLGFYG
jgi:hypothetical protein